MESLLKKLNSGSNQIARTAFTLGLAISSLLIASCASNGTPTADATPTPAAAATGNDSSVRSPTSTSTEVRSPTSTSTEAHTADNVTVTGGAGDGDTTVNIYTDPQKVKVLAAGNPTGCEKRGEIAVSVKDSIALTESNEQRVREELETLARKKALGLGANAVQPLSAPVAGEQAFAAWSCGGG